MSGTSMLIHLILERFSWHELLRVPEPSLIMNNPAQITAFMESGREDGILAFTYFYHALQATPVIHPGDRVLDLACGPANQLVQIARLNPNAHFVGLDASSNMLDRGRATLARCGVENVDLALGDMTQLTDIGDATIDCVICTMSLHHLPNLEALTSTMREVRRVLKPDGGLYFADFGRLKRASTQRFFAHDRLDSQIAQFTQDYLHSLKAAFSVGELSDAFEVLGPGVVRYQTPLAPFMVIFKSAIHRGLDISTRHLAQELYGRMTTAQQKDFQVFARWLRIAGCSLPCVLS